MTSVSYLVVDIFRQGSAKVPAMAMQRSSTNVPGKLSLRCVILAKLQVCHMKVPQIGKEDDSGTAVYQLEIGFAEAVLTNNF